jgi:UDP-N-acetylglucosamine pyrophosphorylase
VTKASPEERVGVFCLRDERPSVIEYSEMTPEMCTARDEAGLLYGSANIAVHLFRRDFLELHADADLPYHVAHKKIPCIDARGSMVTPDAPNAYKFELFMFDLFPRARGMAVLEVEREAEFAPVKNRSAEGVVDSPDTARRMILDLHRRWALAAGVPEASLKGMDVEVSPLVSYAGEGLAPERFHRDAAQKLMWA